MKIKLVVLAILLMAQVVKAETTTTVSCDVCWRIIPSDELVYYVDVQGRNGYVEEDAWPTAELCGVCIRVVEELLSDED